MKGAGGEQHDLGAEMELASLVHGPNGPHPTGIGIQRQHVAMFEDLGIGQAQGLVESGG
jgi:hypothetical protein